MSSPSTRAAMILPPEAPTSTAPKTLDAMELAQEGGRDATVDGDDGSGRAVELRRRQCDSDLCHIFGEDFALEECALGVEGSELVLGNSVDGGPIRPPAAGEDAAALHNAIGIDPVHPDA